MKDASAGFPESAVTSTFYSSDVFSKAPDYGTDHKIDYRTNDGTDYRTHYRVDDEIDHIIDSRTDCGTGLDQIIINPLNAKWPLIPKRSEVDIGPSQ